jgi:hypothetical protein
MRYAGSRSRKFFRKATRTAAARGFSAAVVLHGLHLLLRFGRPRLRRFGERREGRAQRSLIPALRRQPDVLEPRRQVLLPREQLAEDLGRLGIVDRASLPFRVQRERVGGLEILRIQLQRSTPVLRGFRQVPAPALGERLQPLNGRALGRERRGARQLLRALFQLLLPQEQQPQVRPSRRLLRRQRDHAVELLPREDLLRRLHRRQARVERRNGLAIGRRRELRARGRPAGSGDHEDRECQDAGRCT